MEDNRVIRVNDYSLASYYVEACRNDIVLSNATCFFTKRNGVLFLVTNWHVVSGKDADTLQCLDKKYAAVPNKLKVFLPLKMEDGSVKFEGDSSLSIDILDVDEKPMWYEIKKNGRIVDVALIPISGVEDFYVLPIEDAEEMGNENVHFQIASEIYIIGFPFGRIGGIVPIWKKASVASEPALDMDDMPYYFADTATKPGMSGSPVILHEKRGIILYEEKTGRASYYWTKLVGVYSGRIGANSDNVNDAQLGRVWKESVIDEIIQANVKM